MICCVFGGALAALVVLRLQRLPWIRAPYLAREQSRPDPSNWRLGSSRVVE